MAHKKSVVMGPAILGTAFSAAILNISQVTTGAIKVSATHFFVSHSPLLYSELPHQEELLTLTNRQAKSAEVRPCGNVAQGNAIMELVIVQPR
ncbi:MAG: hypothetical protein ABR910_03260 [Acidobacteriaceae bacterium]|jgi:hypothetical protein